jgi:excisionase family DNA binding protein
MLSVCQAATRAGVSTGLVYAWVGSGELAHYRLGTKRHRGKIAISETDLDAFVQSLRVEAKGPESVPAPGPKKRPADQLLHVRLSN